jgi:hypothetical protein
MNRVERSDRGRKWFGSPLFDRVGELDDVKAIRDDTERRQEMRECLVIEEFFEAVSIQNAWTFDQQELARANRVESDRFLQPSVDAEKVA